MISEPDDFICEILDLGPLELYDEMTSQVVFAVGFELKKAVRLGISFPLAVNIFETVEEQLFLSLEGLK